MADPSKPNEMSIEELGVYVAPELRAGKYSNAVQLNVSTSDIALNFIYVNPSDEPKGTLVSRVVIPHEQAEKLSETLMRALEAVRKAEEDK